MGGSKHTRTVINVPADKLWSIITSFQYEAFSEYVSYAKWEGDYKLVGTKGVYKFKMGKGHKEGGMAITAYDDTAQGKSIAWGKKVGCIITAERSFAVEAIDENSCAFVHGLMAGGLVSYLLPLPEMWDYAEKFNNDLKKHAEAV